MKETFHHISRILQLQGIDISKYDVSFLGKSLQKRIMETHCKTDEEYYSLLEQDNDEGKFFSDSLHNSYTRILSQSVDFFGFGTDYSAIADSKEEKPPKIKRYGYGRLHVPPDRKHIAWR